MTVMRIREVPVAVGERGMVMNMRVGLTLIPRLGMGVLMVRIVAVLVSMLRGVMLVVVRMALGQVQP